MDDWYDRGDSLVGDLAAETTADDEEPGENELVIDSILVGDDEGIDRQLEELTRSVESALPVDGFHMPEELVKNNLEDVLLVLIGLHGETHGKELMSDIANLSGVQLSPGTLYPVLHDLESEGYLTMHKKVRTKAYSIKDPGDVVETLERSMIEHMSFGLLQYAFLAKYRDR